jgi:hypothetical protein
VITPPLRRFVALAAAALVLGACGSGSSGAGPADPSGSPFVQDDVVARHASQFDGPLVDRPAGSQQEFAAATYILGHLQRAGYVPLLDPVPVEDTIRSTNVVAAPPRASAPSIVVVVAYDSPPGARPSGTTLGLWLELARALYARAAHNSVEFVALGAERTPVGEGQLGARRLIEFLREDDLSPLVVSLTSIEQSERTIAAAGEGSEEVEAIARRLGVGVDAPPSPTREAALFGRAGLSYLVVSGGAEEVGRVLLDYLVGSTEASQAPSL